MILCRLIIVKPIKIKTHGILALLLFDITCIIRSRSIKIELLWLIIFTIIGKTLFNFLLSVQMIETLIINAQIELFSQLRHDYLMVLTNCKCVNKNRLKNLPFVDQSTVKVNASSARQL